MRFDVARDLTCAHADFVRFAWPAIRAICGGGELRPVETTTDAGFDATLDQLAGIDAWQVASEHGVMRGIASRVQWSNDWRTFTVRYTRDSGAVTEFEKRLKAMEYEDAGWLMPGLTVQAYIGVKGAGPLLSAAVVTTRELYRHLARLLPQIQSSRRDYYLQRTDNATFIVANWAALIRDGIDVQIVGNGASQPHIVRGRKQMIMPTSSQCKFNL